MKFAISVTMERFSADEDMRGVIAHALDLVKLADQGGFDIAFTAEHHTIEFTISPNPLITLTHWAARTSRIRLGTATIVAPYWQPIRLAGEAALADRLTDGRLELGIARGAYQYEFDRMAGGMPQQEGVAYLKEIVPAVKALWAGDYAHEGHYWSFPAATSVPKPLQQPHPPIWVAARDPGTFDWAVANGCDIMTTPLSRPAAEVQVLADKFEKAVADHPSVPRPRLLMLRRACVYERAEDWRLPVEASIRYGQCFENLFKNIGTVENGFPEPVAFDAVANRDEYQPENVRENMLFGTPDEVVEKLKLYEQAGVDVFCYGATFGLDRKAALRSLELFIERVMPHFQTEDDERSSPARAHSA
ncbi:Flavin-dependent oxidoreductase, luciferase family (includes alkanesulfonate monooxygenase SsuD and methylene tetrahydromethanopterin reductase) [Tistlia consotensis]|uniref:Flavin-dependent oxidoreductase, luciferase family (Includes alkanesulfonate monooxygenase SsuD and methylene tetrahydromethanopterin reductase) n=1 Tax=Tistlia consotensis USBA 355 TaxID=560819 RepID=A0A1Y6BYP7_9PROT|nr:LLM class flavin-dependent oxidoreductase [Tistlia consotensis]SMF36478.1 Flavin-dependent oxidoreductase, luciferase family (includes alkanesulfonate monooxygenase SsuD and methylene tetrahydromethanopterin reductase) [Tistlia consotensis USBA 355]SNR71974.1 Flavin-dependent oxidoreductase, luciferase family (includes alkanesulfonate monooxygenase SsuD and methylene tetrahydromethanopterin reductase) [Tistlia consotensis]